MREGDKGNESGRGGGRKEKKKENWGEVRRDKENEREEREEKKNDIHTKLLNIKKEKAETQRNKRKTRDTSIRVKQTDQ